MKRLVYRTYVDIPADAGEEVHHAVFNAVADAVFETVGEDREDWDPFVYTHGMVEEELADPAEQGRYVEDPETHLPVHPDVGRDDDYTAEAINRTTEDDPEQGRA